MSIYKGNKLVAGGSIDTHFVRRPAWDQAVAVSVASILSKYKVPADGMIVGLLFTNDATSTGVSIHVNGVEIARNKAKDSDRILNVQCLVSKDDVITITGDDAGINKTSSTIRFVPFEDSTVSDIEVVTPELIRNLHDPDWTKAITIKIDQLSSGYTAPGRGIIVGWVMGDIMGSSNSRMSITVNGVVIGEYTYKPNDWTSYPSIQVPVNKNDVIKSTQEIQSTKNMDMSFVPYKAQ